MTCMRRAREGCAAGKSVADFRMHDFVVARGPLNTSVSVSVTPDVGSIR
jgi:hypothetical protein